MSFGGFLDSSNGKESACNAGDLGSGGDNLEKGMATHFSILAWTEEQGGLQYMGLQRVRHD